MWVRGRLVSLRLNYISLQTPSNQKYDIFDGGYFLSTAGESGKTVLAMRSEECASQHGCTLRQAIL